MHLFSFRPQACLDLSAQSIRKDPSEPQAPEAAPPNTASGKAISVQPHAAGASARRAVGRGRMGEDGTVRLPPLCASFQIRKV